MEKTQNEFLKSYSDAAKPCEGAQTHVITPASVQTQSSGFS